MNKGFNYGRDYEMMDGLKNMRKLPNGRIDFLSVNEMARLMANQIYHMRNMKLPDDN